MLYSRSYRLRRIFIYAAAFVLIQLIIAHAQQEIKEPIANELQKNGASKVKLDEELFKRLFFRRRKEHLEAVQILLKIDNYERLYKMIMMLMDKIVEILELSRDLVEKANFIPDNSLFPQDANIKDALSNILENTALFGDIILHLPDITHRILKAHEKWNFTIHWSLHFANQAQYLLDKSTITMIHLVEQELNITEREQNYFNPYKTSSIIKREDVVKKKKAAKRNKRKKGPQITKIEL